MTIENTQAQEGYMTNQAGHLVPASKVHEIDKLRDNLVVDMIFAARAQRDALSKFKHLAMDDIQAFIQLSGERYDVHLGGQKGNVTLLSYDGKFKIQRSISETLVFDERLQVAKELVDQCIQDWAKDSNDNVKALVEHAFQVDKQGKISTGRVLGLRQLKITDNKWQHAMQAIADSINVANTKSYVRFYERDEHENWHPISLDIASL